MLIEVTIPHFNNPFIKKKKIFSIEHGLEQQKMRKIVELNVFILETVIHSGSNKLPSVQV